MELGNFSALNAITPVRRGWQWWLRGVWSVLTQLERSGGGRPKGVLMDTSMINSAGWSLLREVRCGIDGQAPHRLDRPYLLFEANFAGALPGYLETFSFVDALGLRVMWQGAYDFPNPAQASRFFEFVDTRKLDITRCYSTYPEASTSMVRAAIELERQISEFDFRQRHLPAPSFAAIYREWLPTVQTIRDPAGQAGKTWSFTAVSVIEKTGDKKRDDEDLEGLKEVIRGLNQEDLAIRAEDPVPQKTHFARLTVADKFLQSFRKNEADHDPTSYLMFSTWFDGATPDQRRKHALDAHLRGLHSRFGGQAEAIWGRCRGFTTGRGPQYFAKYLRGHEIPMGMPFSTYPGRTVGAVKEALALAGRFSQFAVAAQDWDAVKLRREWDFLLGRVPPVRAPAERPAIAPSTRPRREVTGEPVGEG